MVIKQTIIAYKRTWVQLDTWTRCVWICLYFVCPSNQSALAPHLPILPILWTKADNGLFCLRDTSPAIWSADILVFLKNFSVGQAVHLPSSNQHQDNKVASFLWTLQILNYCLHLWPTRLKIWSTKTSNTIKQNWKFDQVKKITRFFSHLKSLDLLFTFYVYYKWQRTIRRVKECYPWYLYFYDVRTS